jgi:predicted amidohydrolase YtcJ
MKTFAWIDSRSSPTCSDRTDFAIAIGGATRARQSQPPVPADLVLLNGRVLTVDEHFSTAEALAVRDGRFVAVGTNEEVRPHIGPRTRVIEAAGRTVLPGIIDSHVHALGVAEAEARQPFRNLRSVAELQGWVRAEAAARPAGTWLWTPRTFPTRLREHRFPTREELDAAAPAIPWWSTAPTPSP